MSTVLFITVHYRNAADVKRFVENIKAIRMPSGWRSAIVVVDNSGEAQQGEGAALLRAPSNLGYLGGAAFGLERWIEENNTTPDWVAVVNPDVEFQADAFEVLAAADPGDDIVAVAPTVMLRGEMPQNPFFRTRPSRFRMWLYTVIFRSAMLTKLFDFLLVAKRRRGGRGATAPEEIYAAHGSVILLRRSFFARGGSLQYRGFMYGEEIHVAEQARAAGGRILYLPDMRAAHRGSSATGGVTSWQRRLWHLQSARVLWNEYFRPMDARIAEVVKRAATLFGLDATKHDGRVLPARYLRLCGTEFRDDAYFLDSARREADRLTRIGLTSDGAVLDVGCGFGRLAIGLADRLPDLRRYEGIDVSVAAVRWCRRHVGRRHPNFRFTHLDLQNARYNPGGRSMSEGFRLPFGDGDFDVAYLYSVFSHMEWPDVRAYVGELHRTVKAGGRVFLTMYAAEGSADVTVNPTDSDRTWTGPLHCVRYRRDFIERHFGQAGFDIDEVSHGTETDGQSGYVLRRR
ncbi:MAG TPA: methyltransferase domain-containing protein [Thermoanaerobaculia bacterium]|nr:methyltransferase domain-containing protein [Thermoanaerobaculia bacterium]